MKKLVAVIIAVLTACLIFAGCANTPKQTDPPEQSTETNNPEKEEITKMYLTVNGNKLEVTLENNSSVTALAEILKKGDIVYTAEDYGGFEKVGNIGHSLPKSDTWLTAQTGDVMLYQGNNIVLFYGSNSYYYTKIGKINGYSVSELKAFLSAGKGDIQITISLQ